MQQEGMNNDAAGAHPPLGSVPLLMYDHGMDSNNRQTAFNVADRSLHTQVVRELAENNFHVTSHGWVFLQDYDSPRTRLWNPRSGASIPLPAMEPDQLPPSTGSAASPSHQPPRPASSSCCSWPSQSSSTAASGTGTKSVGGRSTRRYDIGCVPQLPASRATPPRKRVISMAAALGGRFYFQETGQLGVLDFSPDPPAITFLRYPHAEFPDESSCADSRLVASETDLFEVNVFLKGFTPEILAARVYRFHLSDPEQVTLTEVDDLGDRAVFLSYPNDWLLSSASEYGLQGNRVYTMHNVTDSPDGGFMYVYDMDIKDLMCNPFWMLPPTDK
ncbi:hypothetical protein QOZ80_1BG0092210 [Eleusine coracana subsp. coracana]|nr:hypothetical protein QOZ80_1BG0092210 [Eleusine coracana subsp. coracana]